MKQFDKCVTLCYIIGADGETASQYRVTSHV